VQRPLEKPRYIESDIDESKASFEIDSYPYIVTREIDRNNSSCKNEGEHIVYETSLSSSMRFAY
jgi:hypothetical protein